MSLEQYRTEIDSILARYPEGKSRAAVMPLLYIAQREHGYLSPQAVNDVADLLDLDPTEVGKLIRFYTLYHAEPGGRVRMQICTDLPCALRGAEQFAADVCQSLGVSPGETTDDGAVTVEEVMCLAACDKAPMFQAQTKDGIHYHEDQTVDSALEFVESMRAQAVDD